MGKHNMELPLTVEELAARERAERRRRLTRPAVVATAAAAVLALGAAIWTFALPGPPADISANGTAPAAPASVTEGFGQAVPPSMAPGPSASATRPSRSPGVTPSPGLVSAAPSVVSSPPGPSLPPPPAPGPEPAVTAAYTMLAWPNAYSLVIVVSNKTSAPALWTVRLEVPPGARLDQKWNAEVSQESATVWLFRPPRWDGGNPRPVPAGGEFAFGMIVQGGQTVVSCTLDGVPCRH